MMRAYARSQTALLLHRLSLAVKHAARQADADSIHDVRVAMRRLSRCLRVFAPFYPDASWKKMRRRIAGLMAAAGGVRDCDIAIDLAARAGLAANSVVVRRLAAERRRRGRDLLTAIRHWERRDLVAHWGGRLELW